MLEELKLETVGEYVDIADLPTVREAKVIFDNALQMYYKWGSFRSKYCIF